MQRLLFLSLLLAGLITGSFVYADELVTRTYYPVPNGRYLNVSVAGTLSAGTINASGSVTGSTLTASGLTASIRLINGTERFSVVNGGNLIVGGNLNMGGGSVVNVGSLTATGKIISAQTVGGDAGTVLATKSYVDSNVPRINYGSCEVISNGVCSPNHVLVGYQDFWAACPAGHAQHHWATFTCCLMQ